MRRSELLKAIEQIEEAITSSHMVELLYSLHASYISDRSTFDPGNIEPLLETIKTYTLLSQHFNDATNEILKIFNLSHIGEPRFWFNLVAAKTATTRDTLTTLIRSLQFVTEFLPPLADLLRPYEPLDDEHSILSITLPEDTNRLSRPARVVDILQGIQSLYDVCATLNDSSPDDLSILNLDSGSDKSLDLLGAAEVMKCVKEIIIDLWDRVIFFRERRTSEAINLLMQSLPVIDEIGRLEQEGRISHEQAEIIRRKAIEGATKFFTSGATIPELEEHSKFNPRLLMQPEKKLLTTTPGPLPTTDRSTPDPKDTTNEKEPEYTIDDAQDDINLDNLSQSEIEALRKLISKTQNKPPTNNTGDVEQTHLE